MTTPEEDAQTAALQEYFESNTPTGYGASFRAGWEAGKRWAATEVPGWTALIDERDRLVQAVRALGGMGRFAQCPSCLAERTNGERHSDDCPMVTPMTRER